MLLKEQQQSLNSKYASHEKSFQVLITDAETVLNVQNYFCSVQLECSFVRTHFLCQLLTIIVLYKMLSSLSLRCNSIKIKLFIFNHGKAFLLQTMQPKDEFNFLKNRQKPFRFLPIVLENIVSDFKAANPLNSV